MKITPPTVAAMITIVCGELDEVEAIVEAFCWRFGAVVGMMDGETATR